MRVWARPCRTLPDAHRPLSMICKGFPHSGSFCLNFIPWDRLWQRGALGWERAPQRSAPHAARQGRGTVLAVFFSSFPQDFLQGDCTKAKQKLNWKPRVTFDVSGVLCTYPGVRVLQEQSTGGGGGSFAWAHLEAVLSVATPGCCSCLEDSSHHSSAGHPP